LEVTTDSPFGITQSYSPRMGVEPVETIAPAAKDFAAMFHKVIESSEKAKRNMKLQADKHRNPALDYVVGQQVWLSTDNLQMLNRANFYYAIYNIICCCVGVLVAPTEVTAVSVIYCGSCVQQHATE